jgi:hypothetical protein
MDALRGRSRFRLVPIFEWALAALLLATAVWLGTRVLDAFRAEPVSLVSTDAAGPVDTWIPSSVPPHAVSVPALPLKDGRELRVGDTLSSVAERLGRGAEVGQQDVDRGPRGERLTRVYEYDGARFILVFEPVRADGTPRVAAIYLP